MHTKIGKWRLIIWLCICLTGLCGCFVSREAVSYPAMSRAVISSAETEAQQEKTSETEAEILVHVCGAVKVPGVYQIAGDARVYQAVEAAGGFLEEAQTGAVNLADTLKDGQQIWIPSEGEEMVKSVQPSDGKISINRAAKEELMQLPGIGESRADAIIAYRTEHGDFSKPEDIMLVPGIKEAAYAKLKDRITAD